MLKLKLHFLTIFISVTSSIYSQKTNAEYIYPLDREPNITGNYGEIRPNHFHVGLDFSTDPVLNLPIKSVYDGYVSRIKISSVGYGKVIYITHTNGYVSVYAHQKNYATKIETYIKQKQIAQQKNEIELLLNPNELKVKQGEIIGYTGNSGSSTGPHLHFEIREEKSEIPINPLLIYNIKDNVKPQITHVGIYSANDTTDIKKIKIVSVKFTNGNLSIASNSVILNENMIVLAYSGYDQANASLNKNNIYEVKLSLDNDLIYHHQLNSISFENARYVNIFAEKEDGVKFQKCYTPTCFNISIYKKIINNGKIELKDTLYHKLSLEVFDEKGNNSNLTFYVKTKQIKAYKQNTILYNTFCNKDFNLIKEDLEVSIKAGSLSKNILLNGYIDKQGNISIGNKNVILIQPFTMKVKIPNPIKGKENKLVLINETNCLPSSFENGWLKADSKSFGIFSYSYDTVPPVITLNKTKIKKGASQYQSNISFKVSDKLSGIKDYNLYINGTWSIAEYDAKTSRIICYFNEQTQKGKITIKLEVKDKMENISKFELTAER